MTRRARCLRIGYHGAEIPGTISWEEHIEAHNVFVSRFRDKPNFKLLAAERIEELGGYGFTAITELLGHEPVTWLPTA